MRFHKSSVISQITLRFALMAALTCVANLAFAQTKQATPESAGMSSEKLGLVMPAVQKFVDDKKIAGATILVARNGKIVLLESVGQQEIASKTPMRDDSIYRIYSMTKPVTTTAAMILVGDGKLNLDDPVSKYLNEFSDQKVFERRDGDELITVAVEREMTIRDLMRHTSGLTYGMYGTSEVDQLYWPEKFLDLDRSMKEKSKRLGELPLLYQPGTRFNYSLSTDVLARVVEVVSEMRFDKFLKARIFDPLKMNDTGFFVSPDKLSRFAANYQRKPLGGLRPKDVPSTSPYRLEPRFFSGGGGLQSTATDYWRFAQMILNGGELDGQRLLSQELVAEMTRNQLPKSAYPISIGGRRDGVGFGLGFSVVVEKTNFTRQASIGELAWGGAASTHFWISPKDKLVVVILTQRMPFSAEIPQKIKPMIYDAILD